MHQLQREAWPEPEPDADSDGVSIDLYSATWQAPDGDHVAFDFFWPNLFSEPPCVCLYLPAAEVFAQRNVLLSRLRPKLKRYGFTDGFRCVRAAWGHSQVRFRTGVYNQEQLGTARLAQGSVF
jgi:hypothetical protein